MTPTLTLYKIEAELSELVNARDLAIEEGALPAELEAFDKAIGEYLSREAVKIDSYAGLVRQRLAYATECRKEADRLRDRARALEQSVEDLKKSALRTMQAFDVKVFETPSTKIERRANGGVEPVEIEGWPKDHNGAYRELRFDQIPPGMHDYLREKVFYTPDVAAIRAVLLQGLEIPAAKLLERGEHVRIK